MPAPSAKSPPRRHKSRQFHERSRIALIDVFRDAFEEKDAQASGGVLLEQDKKTVTSQLTQRSNARRHGVNEETLRMHVKEHLSTLMNTIRLDATCDLSDTPRVAKSVLNYGFQDFSDLSRQELIAPHIARSIRQSLIDHEPRLVPASIDVKINPIENDPQNRIGVFVSADLIADPADITIEFSADVDLGAGKCVVSGGKKGQA